MDLNLTPEGRHLQDLYASRRELDAQKQVALDQFRRGGPKSEAEIDRFRCAMIEFDWEDEKLGDLIQEATEDARAADTRAQQVLADTASGRNSGRLLSSEEALWGASVIARDALNRHVRQQEREAEARESAPQGLGTAAMATYWDAIAAGSSVYDATEDALCADSRERDQARGTSDRRDIDSRGRGLDHG